MALAVRFCWFSWHYFCALLPVVALDDAAALMCFGLSVAVAKVIQAEDEFSFLATVGKPVLEKLPVHGWVQRFVPLFFAEL